MTFPEMDVESLTTALLGSQAAAEIDAKIANLEATSPLEASRHYTAEICCAVSPNDVYELWMRFFTLFVNHPEQIPGLLVDERRRDKLELLRSHYRPVASLPYNFLRRELSRIVGTDEEKRAFKNDIQRACFGSGDAAVRATDAPPSKKAKGPPSFDCPTADQWFKVFKRFADKHNAYAAFTFFRSFMDQEVQAATGLTDLTAWHQRRDDTLGFTIRHFEDSLEARAAEFCCSLMPCSTQGFSKTIVSEQSQAVGVVEGEMKDRYATVVGPLTKRNDFLPFGVHSSFWLNKVQKKGKKKEGSDESVFRAATFGTAVFADFTKVQEAKKEFIDRTKNRTYEPSAPEVVTGTWFEGRVVVRASSDSPVLLGYPDVLRFHPGDDALLATLFLHVAQSVAMAIGDRLQTYSELVDEVTPAIERVYLIALTMTQASAPRPVAQLKGRSAERACT